MMNDEGGIGLGVEGVEHHDPRQLLAQLLDLLKPGSNFSPHFGPVVRSLLGKAGVNSGTSASRFHSLPPSV